MSNKIKLKKWLLIIVFVLLGDIFFSQCQLNFINSQKYFLPKSSVDAALVLFGDFDKKNPLQLGGETLRRLSYTEKLFKKGIVNNIICVGGARPGKNIYGSEMAKNFLIKKGIPAKNIFIEKKSFDTKSNWTEAKKIIQSMKWRSIVIISSPLHIYRAKGYIPYHNQEGELKITFSPYKYKNTDPEISLYELWRNIHYELISCIILSLPDSVYMKIVKRIRHQ